jgi:hypothetical protein
MFEVAGIAYAWCP